MNRQQLVDAVGERVGDRKTAAVAVEAVLDTVTSALADGERVALFGFGVFEKVDRAARTARNPATGGTVEVAATSVPRFRPGQALKDAVSGRPAGARRSAPSATAAVTDTAAEQASPKKGKAKAATSTPSAKAGTSKAKSKSDTKDKGNGKTKGTGKAKGDGKKK